MEKRASRKGKRNQKRKTRKKITRAGLIGFGDKRLDDETMLFFFSGAFFLYFFSFLWSRWACTSTQSNMIARRWG